jgi:hypothetical protein
MNNFIPVYKLAKKNGVSQQTMYRLIREKKINPENVRHEDKVVSRILLQEDIVLIKNTEGKIKEIQQGGEY